MGTCTPVYPAMPGYPGTTAPPAAVPPVQERERERESERSREREREREREKKKGDERGQLAAPANLVVDLPADAALTIDDHATASTSDHRIFTTPALEERGTYHYTLKAEIVRNGQKLTATEDVAVRPGAETRVSLPLSKFVSSRVAAK